ncbi:hypothetical protein GCM10009809_08260 [Isoptericola hypogeus]|uniref:HNH endonuclease n=1 Tax=Isoptericola hypogeus TaxID=300179 RepID=A0ABN2IYS6_9MICO
MVGRRCPVPACPVVLTNGERYCTEHAREYERRRGTRKRRGYSSAHVARRDRWQRRIDAGEVVRCTQCGVRLVGGDWQLGHDHERGGYLGPQCVACNASDGGRRGAATTNERRDPSLDHFLAEPSPSARRPPRGHPSPRRPGPPV